jgi:hypothetical protein
MTKTMFHTLSNVQSEKAVPLLQPIDNRAGNLTVGLRSLIYTIGWYNVEGQTIHLRPVVGNTKKIDVPPGLWGFQELKDFLVYAVGAGFDIQVNKKTGNISMVVPKHHVVHLTPGLFNLLGLNREGWLRAGTYSGDRSVNFMTKTLHIHLKQINTRFSVLDGAPSTLLGVIGVGCRPFGDTVSINWPNPEFKRLQCGTLDELRVFVLDDTGQQLDNHGLPISAVLEIR